MRFCQVDPTVCAGFLAASDARVREVLEELGIDYVSSGERTLVEAAAAEGIGVDRILAALSRDPGEAEPHSDWSDASSAEVATRVRREVHPRTLELLAGAAYLFAQRGPGDARTAFRRLVREVLRHVEREERELLPPLEAGELVARELVALSFLEHETINGLLRSVRNGEPLGPVLDAQLVRLTAQLRESMNFENFVLFPRALAPEPAFC